ncbi:Class I glutamine amidotransferase-like protein [Elaphomyces granulatus]|jgi:5'-phosphate synthase pdxT subunit
MSKITVGVLALQGAFYEHLQLLQKAVVSLREAEGCSTLQWEFIEVRNASQLDCCDALILPGGESTTISLVAASSNLLEPLRDFVKLHRKPTWGTCAGLILLAESANRTKKGGQELIGGLDVRVNRNYFGRQTESFQALLDLPFLYSLEKTSKMQVSPFTGIFIRAPIVEKILPNKEGIQVEESQREETIVAPSRATIDPAFNEAMGNHVEVLAKLPGRAARLSTSGIDINAEKDAGDIIAVQQGNVFGTSFHPELTDDPRIHMWWLQQVRGIVEKRRIAKTFDTIKSFRF